MGERRLAAIMFTDMVGFSALTQSDEAQSLTILERHNKLLRPFFVRFHGREVKSIGDSFLVEFDSALDATTCAVEIQRYLHDYNVSSRDRWKITLRIGVHLGDVEHRDGDVFGDAVNIASRLQPLAEPEGVCISEQVYSQVRNKLPFRLTELGPQQLKNISSEVEVYRVELPWGRGSSFPSVAAWATTPSLDKKRIAVLPFESQSPDPSDEYFADGITDELIDKLAQVREVEVIARTSVMTYKGEKKKASQIARELGVGALVEGSVRKSGNRIRVMAELIDGNSEGHLWSSRYDNNLDDVFAVQSEIAEKVAGELKVKLLDSEKVVLERRPTENIKAYTLYLRGRRHWLERIPEEIRLAQRDFEGALAEDPKFALGYVGLSDCYSSLSGNLGIDREANSAKAMELVERALALDPRLAEAHASMGLALFSNQQLREAEVELNRALELKPSYASAYHWYYLLLMSKMRRDEARSSIEKANELDPLSPTINTVHGYYYYVYKDYGRAMELFERVIGLDPGFSIIRRYTVDTYIAMKMFEEAKREAKIMGQSKWGGRDGKVVEAMIAASEGDAPMVVKLLPGIESRVGEPGVDAIDVAEIDFLIGDKDEGFKWLERSRSTKEWYFLFFRNRPFPPEVQEDPRYVGLVERLGLNGGSGGVRPRGANEPGANT